MATESDALAVADCDANLTVSTEAVHDLFFGGGVKSKLAVFSRISSSIWSMLSLKTSYFKLFSLTNLSLFSVYEKSSLLFNVAL